MKTRGNFSVRFVKKDFFEKSTLKRHLASVHEGKSAFRCDICNKGYTKKVHMKRHISRMHEESICEL